jgi:hypothetical protein
MMMDQTLIFNTLISQPLKAIKSIYVPTRILGIYLFYLHFIQMNSLTLQHCINVPKLGPRHLIYHFASFEHAKEQAS